MPIAATTQNDLTRHISVKAVPDFLDCVRHLFENMIFCWSQVLFPHDARPLLEDAWGEIVSNFPDVRAAAKGANLTKVGLAREAVWKLKVHGFRSALRRFVELGGAPNLRDVLGWINSILGSLSTVIPGIDPIRELKETMEKLLPKS